MKNYIVILYDARTDETHTLHETAEDELTAKQQAFYKLWYGLTPYSQSTTRIVNVFPENSACTDSSNNVTMWLEPESKEPLAAKEDDGMTKYFDVQWKEYTEDLAKIAMDEPWSNKTYPDKGILTNYIFKTFKKLERDNGIVKTQDYALFNTGLYDEYYDPIYALQKREEKVRFKTAYELTSLGILERPERANYFVNPELLLFDWHYAINVQYKHILKDPNNMARIPKEIADKKNLELTLDGAINRMRKQVSANYKLAIPQYYKNRIQLLLPLCLVSTTKPDLALVVTKVGDCYQGHTCLTLDMAYNNARLIAKPENNWLSNEEYTTSAKRQPGEIEVTKIQGGFKGSTNY